MKVLMVLALVGATYVVLVGLFERMAPRTWVRAFQRTVNPLFRTWAGFSLGWAVIETTGRRTGLPRRTPVGGRLRGNVFWTVAGDATSSDYVKNISSEPRVRVLVHGRWRTGTAAVLPDDPPRRRLWTLNPANSLFVAIAAKDPMTIRIELSDAAATASPAGPRAHARRR